LAEKSNPDKRLKRHASVASGGQTKPCHNGLSDQPTETQSITISGDFPAFSKEEENGAQNVDSVIDHVEDFVQPNTEADNSRSAVASRAEVDQRALDRKCIGPEGDSIRRLEFNSGKKPRTDDQVVYLDDQDDQQHIEGTTMLSSGNGCRRATVLPTGNDSGSPPVLPASSEYWAAPILVNGSLQPQQEVKESSQLPHHFLLDYSNSMAIQAYYPKPTKGIMEYFTKLLFRKYLN
jgi:hypothetical protein